MFIHIIKGLNKVVGKQECALKTENAGSEMLILTNHMLTDVRHGVELLLADFTREFLFGIAVHDLNVLVQGPQLLERLVAGDTLMDNGGEKSSLLIVVAEKHLKNLLMTKRRVVRVNPLCDSALCW